MTKKLKAKKPVKEIWVIHITGYGEFDFTGTEKEAEEMRAHKARWEHGSGLKWRKSLSTETDLLAFIMGWYFDRGGCPSWICNRRRKLIKELAV